MLKVESRIIFPEEDDLFLFDVYASSRLLEISSWGWNEEQQNQFLRMQYHCQQQSYEMQYPNLHRKIILYGGTKAGRMITALTDCEMVLVDIILLPEFQNKGIGATLLKELQQQAAKASLPLRLSVVEGNPARRLYERSGFQAVDSNGVYTTMKWVPAS